MDFLSGQTIIIIIISACILYYLHQYLKKKSHEYSSKNYWEGRYGLFSKRMDWYTNFSQLNNDFGIENLIKNKYPSNTYKKRILEMGCGNSTLSYDLYNKGFKNITAIDFSENIINKMKEYYKNTSINFQICDFNFMNIFFEQNFFDIIIEKAGLDSIATKGTDDVPILLYKVFKNIHYVLCDGGVVFSFSSKNTDFWRKTIYNRLEQEKLFEIIETKKTVFKTEGKEILMNLYFSYLKKI